MPSFRNGEVEIAYLDQGEGDPVVLVHGFASNKEVNWVNPGWFTTLTRAGRRAIAIDDRGHGQSSKLYEPSQYHSSRMADDVRALLDHLGIWVLGALFTLFGLVSSLKSATERVTLRILRRRKERRLRFAAVPVHG